MKRIGLTGLLKIELPDHTILLCDGGFIAWPDQGETYRSADPLFGAIGAVGQLTEGVAEEVPAFDLTMLPPAGTGPEELSQPGFQRSRVQFWIAEYSPADGILVGDPEPMFNGQIDQTTLSESKGERSLDMTIVSSLEKLFTRNRGNTLGSRLHKSFFAGETGHDNATGLGVPVAWGIENAKGSTGSARTATVSATRYSQQDTPYGAAA